MCGIIAVLRRASRRQPPAPDHLLALLAEAEAQLAGAPTADHLAAAADSLASLDAQLRGVMGHARLFVFPSLVEGFGLPPLEAMAMGVPCAVSDREPMRWVAGEGAVRFDPMDVDELERVITRFMTRDDLCQEYARRGRERAHDFTWERTARETLAVYDEVLSKPVRG